MNLPQVTRWGIPVVLVIVGIVAGFYLSGIPVLSFGNSPGNGRVIPPGGDITPAAAYCTITEYDAASPPGPG